MRRVESRARTGTQVCLPEVWVPSLLERIRITKSDLIRNILKTDLGPLASEKGQVLESRSQACMEKLWSEHGQALDKWHHQLKMQTPRRKQLTKHLPPNPVDGGPSPMCMAGRKCHIMMVTKNNGCPDDGNNLLPKSSRVRARGSSSSQKKSAKSFPS